jgi:hypothetical protein
MESCFQSARAADAVCFDPANDAAKRLDCLGKARTAQLECLNRVLSSPPAGSASSEALPAANAPDMPTGTVPQQTPAANLPPETPTAEVPSDKRPEGGPPDLLPTGSVSPEPAGSADNPALRRSNWVISETTSPLDYSPLITAVTRSSVQEKEAKDAPTSFAVRCRGQRADILVGTQGTWRGSRVNEAQVEYQVDDRPPVRRQWTASEDGKTVSYKDDAVELLRSLPDDARLKISVFDWQGPGHEAAFQLAGLDAVRKKIELACKPTPAGDATPTPARMVRGEFWPSHPSRSRGRGHNHYRMHPTRDASTSGSRSR